MILSIMADYPVFIQVKLQPYQYHILMIIFITILQIRRYIISFLLYHIYLKRMSLSILYCRIYPLILTKHLINVSHIFLIHIIYLLTSISLVYFFYLIRIVLSFICTSHNILNYVTYIPFHHFYDFISNHSFILIYYFVIKKRKY
jgi:hypothetical protein